jgi:hypothetical protein
MLTIDELHLALPVEFGARAGRIARLVADELAAMSPRVPASVDRLVVAPVTIPARAGDRLVASAVAQAVVAALTAPTALAVTTREAGQ